MNFMNILKKMSGAVVLIIALVFCKSTAIAQPHEGEELEKTIAVIGNEVILLSDLEGQLAFYAQQDPSLNIKDPATRQKVLDAMINEKLVIIKAIEDSMVVTDEEIQQGWDYQLANLVRRYGDEKRIEDLYGMSIARIKTEYRDEIRKQILAQKIRQREFGEIKVNQREVELFYEQYKDSLPEVPMQVELYHIVRNVETNKTAKDDTRALALRVRDSIITGGDFAQFALKNSDDKATSASGGELGWFEHGKLFKEFEEAAFALLEGQISQPVETPFGFHLIQTMKKNKDSVFVRHILFRVGQSFNDRENTRKFLLDIKVRIEKGEDFEAAARAVSDEKETQGFGGLLGKFPLNYMPGGFKDIIDTLKDGAISDPIQYGSEPKVSFHIIWKKRTLQPHKANIKDDFKDIQQLAINYKQNKLYLDWVDGLRKTIYWEVLK